MSRPQPATLVTSMKLSAVRQRKTGSEKTPAKLLGGCSKKDNTRREAQISKIKPQKSSIRQSCKERSKTLVASPSLESFDGMLEWVRSASCLRSHQRVCSACFRADVCSSDVFFWTDLLTC